VTNKRAFTKNKVLLGLTIVLLFILAFSQVANAFDWSSITGAAIFGGKESSGTLEPIDERSILSKIVSPILSPFITQRPIAVLSASTNSGDAPLNVDFLGYNSYSPNVMCTMRACLVNETCGVCNGISAYYWDFGDGSGIVKEGPANYTVVDETGTRVYNEGVTHLYTTPGTYTVTLTVTGVASSEQVDWTDKIKFSKETATVQTLSGATQKTLSSDSLSTSRETMATYKTVNVSKTVEVTVKDAPFCTDSDGGKDYNIQGTITTHNDSRTDFCHDSFILREYYCNGINFESEAYNCSNGCSGGACVDPHAPGVWFTSTTPETGTYAIDSFVIGVGAEDWESPIYDVWHDLDVTFFNNSSTMPPQAGGGCGSGGPNPPWTLSCTQGFNDMPDGIYIFTGYGNDTAGNLNWTEERIIILNNSIPNCTDSDGGIDYYTLGYVNGICSDCTPPVPGGNTDHCLDSVELMEFYCIDETNWTRTTVNCTYGCSNGACMPNEPPIVYLYASPTSGDAPLFVSFTANWSDP